MRKFIQNKLKEQKGLTLIELLAVIVILAIIAAIAIPAIGNIIENSRVGAIKSDAQNALAAANIYYTDNANADSGVTLGQLAAAGYLEDRGSLTEGTTISTNTEGVTSNTINGSGYTGGVSITFSNATNAQISAVANNSDGGTNVTIDRDATAPAATPPAED